MTIKGLGEMGLSGDGATLYPLGHIPRQPEVLLGAAVLDQRRPFVKLLTSMLERK